jgi:O-antigen/teichoic acid export membrane protein
VTTRIVLPGKFNQNVLWNLASLGFLAVGGVVINILVITLRGAAALGIFNQVYAIYIVLSQLGVGGIQYSVLTYVAYAQDDRPQCSDITLSALVLVAFLTLGVCLIAWQLAEPVGQLLGSPAVAEGLRLALPGLLFFSLNKVLLNVLNGLQLMRAYAVFRSLRFILIPLGVILIVLFDYPDSHIAFSLTFAEAALFVALVIYVYAVALPLRRPMQLARHMKTHISYGVRGVLSGVLLELNTRVDVLMLGYFTTDRLTGIYSFAAMLAEGFGQIPLALRWNIDPLLGQYFSTGETHKITQLARSVRRMAGPLMVAGCLVAVLLYPLGARLFLSVDRAISWQIFAIIMLGVAINAIYRPFGGILLLGGRPELQTVFIIGLVLLDALLNLIFIPLLGIRGAALVTMGTYIFEAAGIVLFARLFLHVSLLGREVEVDVGHTSRIAET